MGWGAGREEEEGKAEGGRMAVTHSWHADSQFPTGRECSVGLGTQAEILYGREAVVLCFTHATLWGLSALPQEALGSLMRLKGTKTIRTPSHRFAVYKSWQASGTKSLPPTGLAWLQTQHNGREQGWILELWAPWESFEETPKDEVTVGISASALYEKR